MDERTRARPSVDRGPHSRYEPEHDVAPSDDEISVVFRSDPPPVVTHHRPAVLSLLWLLTAVMVAIVVAYLAREAFVRADGGVSTARVLDVGEFRSLSDDGTPVEFRCDERRPSALGSPCLRVPEVLDELLAGRSSVVLVGNVASARDPDGALRCVEVRAVDAGAIDAGDDSGPSAGLVRCPSHGFVAG